MQLQRVIYEAPETLFYKCDCTQINPNALKQCSNCGKSLEGSRTTIECTPEEVRKYPAYHHDLIMTALVLSPVGPDAHSYSFTEYASHPSIVATLKHLNPDRREYPYYSFIQSYNARELIFRGVLRLLERNDDEVPDEHPVGPEHYWVCNCGPETTAHQAIHPNSMDSCRICGLYKRDSKGRPAEEELAHYPRFQRDQLTVRCSRVETPIAARQILRHPAIEAAFDYLNQDLWLFIYNRRVRNLLLAGAFELIKEIMEEHKGREV